MAKINMDSVITVRCTKEEKEAISTAAWKKRKSISSLIRPYVEILAKQAKD